MSSGEELRRRGGDMNEAEKAERAWMLDLPVDEFEALTHYRVVSMRDDIPEFVGTDPGGITPWTVACEMGWLENDPQAVFELSLVYQVILELVSEGVLAYRGGLLRTPSGGT